MTTHGALIADAVPESEQEPDSCSTLNTANLVLLMRLFQNVTKARAQGSTAIGTAASAAQDPCRRRPPIASSSAPLGSLPLHQL
jgi:hypothetical protein